ncbi:MAG: hypothetical protein ABI155_04145 [Paralcaligenes sp.]
MESNDCRNGWSRLAIADRHQMTRHMLPVSHSAQRRRLDAMEDYSMVALSVPKLT